MTSNAGVTRSQLLLNRPGAVRLLKIGGLISFLVAWQIAGSASPTFYSTPTRVLNEMLVLLLEDDLVKRIFESGLTMLLGLSLSIVIGLAVGLGLGLLRVFSVAFEPLLAGFYTVPTAPWIPLMVVWFGIDREFAVSVVVMATAVQLAFATTAGIRVTERQFNEVSGAYGIRGWTLFSKVLLPGSIPFMGAGMRLAIKHAFTAVLIAEYLVGLSGLGVVIRGARESLATDRVFASAIAILAVGFALIGISVLVERRLQRWRPVTF
jgi:NitT/TauT family transport system permease protein